MADHARTTPLAVVMDDEMKTWLRAQAKELGMPTASLIRRILQRWVVYGDRSQMHYLTDTPDPILDRRNEQLQKGSAS